MEKYTIINLKLKDISDRKVAEILGIDRKTVAKYWKEYNSQLNDLEKTDRNIRELQEEIVSNPKYDSSNRKAWKYTKEMDEEVNRILVSEKRKDLILGTHKQKLSNQQIHKRLVDKGFKIGYGTINSVVNEKTKGSKECFIKQQYSFGDRLEYDFGEVKLVIAGEKNTYHMAVLSSPAGNFRWAYLYTNQKKEVFMDSHVKFFEMVKGVYKEVVYDNMKNVVKKFIGKNEKELNEDLIKMSIYYGFNINVTNCYSGNEKGYVESSVKLIRNNVFASKYEFETFEQAQKHLKENLIDMNSNSSIEEEMKNLLPYRPKLELSNISNNKVNKYSFVSLEKNFYSVPEYLVGKKVTIKSYYDSVLIYSNGQKVCEHKKIDGSSMYSIDINHYLNTFLKKPGALKNSLALKSVPLLKTIYDNHFSKEPKQFVEILIKNKDNSIDDLIEFINNYLCNSDNAVPVDNISSTNVAALLSNTKNQINMYNKLLN